MATAPRNIRLDDETWKILDELAKADHRTIASLIRKIVADHIATHG